MLAGLFFQSALSNFFRSNIKSKLVLSFLIFFTSFQFNTFSQCTGGVAAGALTPVPNAVFQTMAVSSNRYYTFVVPVGCLPTYEFSFCAADGGASAFDSQITILDNAGAYAGGYSDDVCGASARLTWVPTVAGTYRILINTYNCAATVNAATLAYRATVPANMTYTSSTSVDVVPAGTVEICAVGVPMTRLEVITGGGNCNLLTLSQVLVNITGTSPLSAVDRVHVYYTGTSATFSTTNEFVVGGLLPLASLTFNDTRTLALGTNYFWITFDFNNTGVVGNTIGAQLPAGNSITVVTPRTPTARPNCLRTFGICGPYPNTASLWLKGNAGTSTTTDGAAVSSWNSQAVAPVVSVAQATAALQPIYREGSGVGVLNRFNYNPSVFTDGTSNRLIQTGNINLGSSTTGFSVYQVVGQSAGVVSMEWYHTVNGNLKIKGDALMYVLDAGTVGPSGVNNTYNSGGLETVQGYLQTVRGTPTTIVGNGKFNGTTGPTYSNGWRVAVQNGICIGSNLDNGEFMNGGMGEFIVFPSVLSSALNLRVESYLAIKYGITLGSSAAPSDYTASDGTVIWTANAPYQNNIIGIGRDNAVASSLLLQKQSHYYSDEVRLYRGALATTNINNAATFAVDKSFVVVGANTGLMCATAASNAEVPAACGLYSRIEREWRATKTNMNESFNMDFSLAACAVPGSVAIADLRLLVDDDGNFGNGGTSCYSNATNPGLFTYTNPVIRVTGITAAMIPNNSTQFITIGSVNVLTPLPIELLNFDAQPNQKRTVDLTWATSTEINSDYFVAQKSKDIENWEDVCFVEAAGNSTTEFNYACEDNSPNLGTNYYRLKQVDKNGVFKYSETRVVRFDASQDIAIYPNPTNSIFSIQIKNIDSKEITFFNAMGQKVSIPQLASSKDLIQFETESLAEGIYYIQVTTGIESKTYKLIVLKNK